MKQWPKRNTRRAEAGPGEKTCVAIAGFGGCCKTYCNTSACAEHPLVRHRCRLHQDFSESTKFDFTGMMGPGTISARGLGFREPDQ